MKHFLLLIWILGAAVAVRVHLSNIPFSREEGEFAYVAQRASFGDLPYRDVQTGQGPANFWLYRIGFKLFGESFQGIRLFSTLYLLLILLAFGGAIAPLLGPDEALCATAALAAALSPPTFIRATPEFFVLLPLLLAVIFLWRAKEKRSLAYWAGAGIFLGSAVTIKLLAVTFLLLPIDLLSQCKKNERKLPIIALTAGLLVPLILWAGYFAAQGAFLALWTQFALRNWDYVAHPLPGGLFLLIYSIFAVSGSLWPLFIAAGIGGRVLARERSPESRFALGWAAASLVLLLAGRHFFAWYLILAAPAAAALAGFGLDWIFRKTPSLRWRLAVAWVLLTQLAFIAGKWRCLREKDPSECSNAGRQAYAETLALARRAAEITAPQDALLVLGSEPQILFYAKRKSAVSTLLYDSVLAPYPEALEEQRRSWEEIERSRPKAVALLRYPESLPISPRTPPFLGDRVEALLRSRYILDTALSRPGEGVPFLLYREKPARP